MAFMERGRDRSFRASSDCLNIAVDREEAAETCHIAKERPKRYISKWLTGKSEDSQRVRRHSRRKQKYQRRQPDSIAVFSRVE